MRHKVSKIAASGKLVPITEVVCDGFIIQDLYTVHFYEFSKKRWFKEADIEIVATLLLDSAFIVERA